MLAGYPPFFTTPPEDGSPPNPVHLYEKIILGQVAYPMDFDPLAVDIIKRCLTSDLTIRFGNGRDRVHDHKWFTEVDWPGLERGEIDPPYVPPVGLNGDDSM